MNIREIINPSIFGRDGINDSAWSIRVSVTHGYNLRIQFKNSYTFTTKTGIKKKGTFNIIFFMYEDGEIEFNRITICKGGVTNHTQRIILKDELYSMFNYLRVA